MSDEMERQWEEAWSGGRRQRAEANLRKSVGGLAEQVGRIEDDLRGLGRCNITDMNGRIFTVMALDSGQAIYPAPWWPELAGGGFVLYPGKVYTDYGNWDDPLPVQDADLTFTMQAGRQVWLELDVSDPETPELSLHTGQEWGWAPDIYKMEPGETGVETVTRAAFPIRRFRAGEPTAPNEFLIGENLTAEQMVRAPHSIIIWGVRRMMTTDERNDQTFVPVLVPLT